MVIAGLLLSASLLEYSGRFFDTDGVIAERCLFFYGVLLLFTYIYAGFIRILSRSSWFHSYRRQALTMGFSQAYRGDCVEALKRFRKVLLLVPTDKPSSAAVAVTAVRMGRKRMVSRYLGRLEDADRDGVWKNLIWVIRKSN